MEHYKEKCCLNGSWRLYIAENKDCADFADEICKESELKSKGITAIEGSVPGNFELDMQKAGLVGDFFYDVQTLEAQKLENRHLWYVTNFNMKETPTDEWYFLFEGVDTCAEYFLNGEYLDQTANMLISHRIETEGNLKKGKNELLVHILPVMIAARNYHFDASCNAMAYNSASLTIRKAASMYGWDIMPRIISGGIWRSVYLCLDKEERIEDFYIFNRSKDNPNILKAYISTTVTGDFIQEYSVTIEGVCGDSAFTKTKKMWNNEETVSFEVENPKLWWPRTMGTPNLYDITVTLRHGDEVIDTKTLRYGIRTAELVKTDYIDENGEGDFKFLINGKPFFAFGTNWVPLDAYHSRDKERMSKALELLLESGSNIVRCWGGNVYEDESLYDFCDENGIVIWQDFGMGCAMYPFDNDFCERLEYEVEEVVRKYRQHSSLVLWAGDNEVDAFVYSYHDPNKNILTREVIPKVLERMDPCRSYLPSSPYYSQKTYDENKCDRIPENHLWGPRRYYKEDFYKNAICRFASETGYHGCNSPEGIKKFIKPENLWPWKDNNAWLVHSASMEITEDSPYAYRIPLMASHIDILFGDTVPDNLNDFAMASQISQSEAKKYFIERFRTGKINWERTGIIWWNLLDGWPQFSDAVVDYYYYRKLAYFTISRIQNPVCVMFRDPSYHDGYLELCAANERLENKKVYYKVTDIKTDKTVMKGEAELPENSAQVLGEIPQITEQTLLLIEYTVDGVTYKNHYLTGEPSYNYAEVKEWLSKAGLLTVEGF